MVWGFREGAYGVVLGWGYGEEFRDGTYGVVLCWGLW